MTTPTLIHSGGLTRIGAITPIASFQILGQTVSGSFTSSITNNDALPALNDVADIRHIGDSTPPQGPQDDIAAGRLIFSPTSGSVSMLAFFGTDAANETASGRLWAWHQYTIAGPAVNETQWVKYLLCEFTLTLGTRTGVAGGLINASQLWADTITITTNGGLMPNKVRVLGRRDGSDALTPDNTQQYLLADMLGAAYGEVEITRNGQTAASIGVAVAHLSGV